MTGDLAVANNAALVLQNVGGIVGSLTAGGADFSDADTGLMLDGGKLTVTGSFLGGANSSTPNGYQIDDGGELDVKGALTAHSSRFELSKGGQLKAESTVGGGGSRYTIDGDASVFTAAALFTSDGDTIAATNGGVVALQDLQEGAGGVSLSADNTSSVEIGWSGGKATTPAGAPSPSTRTRRALQNGARSQRIRRSTTRGRSTVADGETLSIAGALSGGGSIEVRPDATLALNGELSLAGTIKLDAGATLTVDSASPASATTIAFTQDGWTSTSGAERVSLLSGDFDLSGDFAPLITGVEPTNVIDSRVSVLTKATSDSGVLTITHSDDRVETLHVALAQGYVDSTFAALLHPHRPEEPDRLSRTANDMVRPSSSSQSEALCLVRASGGAVEHPNVELEDGDDEPAEPMRPRSRVTSAAVPDAEANDDVTIPAAPDQGAYAIVGDEQALTFRTLSLQGETLLDGTFYHGGDPGDLSRSQAMQRSFCRTSGGSSGR